MAFVTLIVTVVYIKLLEWITKPLLYTSLVLILVLGVATGYYAYKETIKIEDKTSDEYKIAVGGSAIIWIIVGLYVIFICCFWKSIALGASIMEAASEFITNNKRIIFLPPIAYLLCIPVIVWWTSATVYIYSLGTPKYEEKSFIATMENTDQSNYMLIFMLFGLFWIIAFFIAVQTFATSCTTCLWYFTGSASDSGVKGTYSVWMAVKWGVRYHLGSLAFGAFLVAVVTMIRVIFEYIIYQYEKSGAADKDNAIYKCVKCCIRGVLKCLDCCVKYINKNAYIQIALHNSTFCTAAKESFFLNMRNGGRFSAVSLIGSILTIIGKGLVTVACTFLTIVLIDVMVPDVKQPYLPAFIIGFFAYMVSGVFLSLFQDSALTILHCFCLDEELKKDGRGGQLNFTPACLTGFIEMADTEVKRIDEQRKIQPNKVE
jgi:choline transporter-like protein 2/4/5